MADDVIRASTPETQATVAAPAVPARTPSRAERARRTVYRGRFALLYLLLAAVAGAAVGATIVLIDRGSPAPAPAWSSWKPTGSAERREAQIADHISSKYRLPSGNQLATVIAGPPTATTSDGTTVLLRAFAVRPDTSKGQAEAIEHAVPSPHSA